MKASSFDTYGGNKARIQARRSWIFRANKSVWPSGARPSATGLPVGIYRCLKTPYNAPMANIHPPFTLRRSRRAHSVRMAVYCDGTVTVTAPPFIPKILINHFVSKHTEWIAKKVQQVQTRPRLYTTRGNRKEFIAHREHALVLAQERLQHFNASYNFSYKKITIRNQKTRWGSCSKKGNLSFNYKVALLPPHLADYIIVHELCHLGAFNHSEKFWGLVAQTIPDYKSIKREFVKT